MKRDNNRHEWNCVTGLWGSIGFISVRTDVGIGQDFGINIYRGGQVEIFVKGDEATPRHAERGKRKTNGFKMAEII